MKLLTKAEEEVMQHLWKLKNAFVKEVVAEYPDPKPAYNTISTLIRILEKKGYVSYESYGKTHRYYPIVTKQEYSKYSLKKMLTGYFEGSYSNLVSFFMNQEKLSTEEIEELQRIIDENKNKND